MSPGTATQPFSTKRLGPPNLFRLKGWVRFKDSHGHLDFTAGRYRISPMDEPRNTALTFIGRNCDETGILAALKDCHAGIIKTAQ
ncbi:MAG: GTP-binding protein [Deltaproteobacteria bacterium]|nr:GTP-binding protein [Deltaproteobacteria bacterium]